MINAFTVDVEDYYHVSAFADRIPPTQWETHESRVVPNTYKLLRILDDRQVRGTFFILGWVADRHPELVRDIHRSGHDLGCHSYWHRLVYDMTPEEFRDDLVQARDAIASVTAEPVTAYRAPSFSITGHSIWALDILAEEGFLYDSSIFPVYHDRYGIPNAERFPYQIETEHGALWEFPPSVHRVLTFNLPVAGGGYFRLYPGVLSAHWLAQINKRHSEPFVFYIHPWEVDPDQPRLPGPWKSRFRHYQNLRSTQRKLEQLLQKFEFGTLHDALTNRPQERSGVPPRTVCPSSLACAKSA